MSHTTAPRINKIVVIVSALLISALFLSMIREFLLTILLAGIFAGLLSRVFTGFRRLARGHASLGAALTIMSFFLVVFLPMAALLVVVASEALSLSSTAIPLIRSQLRNPTLFDGLSTLPFYHEFEAYSDVILQKAGELLGRLGTTLFERFSAITYTAIYDVFLFFIFWYTLFFLLKDGKALFDRVRACLPLNESDQRRLFDKFISVARATLKGTLVIGIVQGSLAGMAFRVAGIESAVFWGAVMAMLSILPMIGPPIVWVPAAISLALSGDYLSAAGLFAFCSLVVGQIDNILRPILVGRDTQMHELFVFFGTLGGIGMFGIFGFIIGPVVAALFVTVWEIYWETFRDTLKDVRNQVSPGAGDEESDGGGV